MRQGHPHRLAAFPTTNTHFQRPRGSGFGPIGPICRGRVLSAWFLPSWERKESGLPCSKCPLPAIVAARSGGLPNLPAVHIWCEGIPMSTRATSYLPAVLFVDPDMAGARALTDTLAARYAVGVVGSLAAAYQALAVMIPTLLVCELTLPDGDGLTLLQQMRAAPRHAPSCSWSFRSAAPPPTRSPPYAPAPMITSSSPSPRKLLPTMPRASCATAAPFTDLFEIFVGYIRRRIQLQREYI